MGGRTTDAVRIKKANNTTINPATEEKQDTIIANQVSTDLEEGNDVTVGTTEVEVTFTGATKSIVIRADIGNTGIIYVGKTGVQNDGTGHFAKLWAGDEITIDYNDATNAIYLISDTAAQTVSLGALL